MPTRPSSQADQLTTSPPPEEGITERVDATGLLDDRVRREAVQLHEAQSPQLLQPGRYLEVQGPRETLLVRVEREVTRIGRGLAADLRIDDTSVSRRHAMLVSDQAGARILDDRSSNGTLLNGERVEQAALKSGDVLILGRVALRFLEV
jgi:pSer/pThr/pTyr-binding forkhead associated (FHA) protein